MGIILSQLSWIDITTTVLSVFTFIGVVIWYVTSHAQFKKQMKSSEKNMMAKHR